MNKRRKEIFTGMSIIKQFWIDLGFKPHPSNMKHFWAGAVFCLIAFLFVRHELNWNIWHSLGTGLSASFVVGLGKEVLDRMQKKLWDWLDLIYTCLGGFATCIGLLIIHAIIRFV